MAINFPPNATDPNPPSDGDTYVDAAGTEWVYDSTNNSWTISDNGASLDERYVKLDGDDTNVQTITGDAGLKTEGLLESASGISVTGETDLSNIDPDDSIYPYIYSADAAGGKALSFKSRSADATGSATFTMLVPQQGGPGGGVSITHNKVLDGAQQNNLKILGNWSGDYSGAGGSSTAFNAYLLVSSDLSGATTSFDKPVAGIGVGCEPEGNDFVGIRLRGKGTNSNLAESWVGVKSEINSDAATTAAYNIYVEGTAPNFLQSNTYIGGNVARNTFDLWKSTLTEEQLEQLEAGTLVAPANVGTPGDGSFARQWYYDQQDAETQAALDAGELAYPAPLAAATFTDTFALGDNTKINLNSNGSARFKGLTTHEGGVHITGITNVTDLDSPLLPQISASELAGGTRLQIQPRGANNTDNVAIITVNPPQASGPGGGVTINHDKNTTDTQGNVLKIAGEWTGDYTTSGGSQTAYNSYALVQADITGATTSADKPITGFGVGTRIDAGKHWCAFKSTGLVSGDTPGDSFIGFQSLVQKNAATEAYNFYATGTAPNYFAGNTYIGGTDSSAPNINLNSDGSATFASAEFAKDIAVNEITVGSGPGADNTNIVFGFSAFKYNISGSGNTACGMMALYSNTEGSNNTAIGDTALFANTAGNKNTAIGHYAGRYAVDTTPAATFSNCTYLGYDTRASGDNQVQLGDSNTTTYTFGAVQDRSDERDKTDIRDTLLGLDFIKSLRPVDFRWDYRDDYFDKKEVTLKDGTTEEQLVPVTKDGSRARTRFHHGLIAQEVKAAADAQGIDFAGYQDHSVNGGLDVLSIGYTEMIAPLIKAVQELSAENAALKKRLDDAGL